MYNYSSTLFWDALMGIPEKTSPTSCPPHDMIMDGPGLFHMDVVCAGFFRDEIDVSFDGRVLSISASRSDKHKAPTYTHHGILKQTLKASWEISKDAEVLDAVLQNGILTIKFKIKTPEPHKGRKVLVNLVE